MIKVFHLPLHRAIKFGWGSESEWAIQMATFLAQTAKVDLTAMVGYADDSTLEALNRHMKVIDLSGPSPAINTFIRGL